MCVLWNGWLFQPFLSWSSPFFVSHNSLFPSFHLDVGAPQGDSLLWPLASTSISTSVPLPRMRVLPTDIWPCSQQFWSSQVARSWEVLSRSHGWRQISSIHGTAPCDKKFMHTQSLSCDSLRPHGLWLTRLLCPWNFPSKNTGVDCHFLFQGIFLTQGPNPCLLHLLNWQADFFTLGSPTTKNYLVLNISSTEIQKPCCGFKKRALGRGWILPALPLAGGCLWKVLSLVNSMYVMEGQRLHGRWI